MLTTVLVLKDYFCWVFFLQVCVPGNLCLIPGWKLGRGSTKDMPTQLRWCYHTPRGCDTAVIVL